MLIDEVKNSICVNALEDWFRITSLLSITYIMSFLWSLVYSCVHGHSNTLPSYTVFWLFFNARENYSILITHMNATHFLQEKYFRYKPVKIRINVHNLNCKTTKNFEIHAYVTETLPNDT